MTDTYKIDQIFSMPLENIGDFNFDEQVAQAFPDMLKRSIPGYSNTITTIGILTKKFAMPNSNLYDLGCSLGDASLAMVDNIPHDTCNIIAVDNSSAMIERFQQRISNATLKTQIEILLSDIRSISIEKASVVALNFTLQFLPPEDRYNMLEKIYHGLAKGGVLILSEKFIFSDKKIDNLIIDLHHGFKRANGYSQLEIDQKRKAIANIMIPDTITTHKERLQRIGFEFCETWFQCFNFGSLIAIK